MTHLRPGPAAPPSPHARKRDADTAGLSPRADDRGDGDDRFDRSLSVGAPGHPALRISAPRDSGPLRFIPTPHSPHDAIYTWEESGLAVEPSRFEPDWPGMQFAAPPPAPAPFAPAMPVKPLEHALGRAEARLLANTGSAPTPEAGLNTCLGNWMRLNTGRIGIDALRSVIMAYAERVELPDDHPALQETLRFLALTRETFGDTVAGPLRNGWFRAMQLDFTNPQDADAWQRRRAVAGRVRDLRHLVGPDQYCAVIKSFLVASAAGTTPLDDFDGLLNHHAEFGLTRGAFAAMIMNGRTSAWLTSSRWDGLAALAGTIHALGLAPQEAQTLFRGVLDLRAMDVQQLSRFLQNWCDGRGEEAGNTFKHHILTGVTHIGYEAVLGARSLIFERLSTDDAIAVAALISRFTQREVATNMARMLRCALVPVLKLGTERRAYIDAVASIVSPEFEARPHVLDLMAMRNAGAAWVREMARLRGLGSNGPIIADLAAIGMLANGWTFGTELRFATPEKSWTTHIDHAGVLLDAIHAWGLHKVGAGLDAWLVSGGLACVVNSGGQAIGWVAEAATAPSTRAALAFGLANVPPEAMRDHLQQVVRFARTHQFGEITLARTAHALMPLLRNGGIDMGRAFLQVLGNALNPQVDRIVALSRVLALANLSAPAHARLTRFSTQGRWSDTPAGVANAIAFYYKRFAGRAAAAGDLLLRLTDACERWMNSPRGLPYIRPVHKLLEVAFRTGDALPNFMDRAHARGVPERNMWFVLEGLTRMPPDGVFARIYLAAFSTDHAMDLFAATPFGETLEQVVEQIVLEAQARMADGENVHNATRIRATETALHFLRNLDTQTPLDAQAHFRDMSAYMDTLATQGPDTVWHRTRHARGRTTLGNARYVLTGPFYEGRDLSRSVAEDDTHRDVVALVWRAIAMYTHPSGDPAATAREKTLMRDAVIIGLAECVRDETGFRVCPVGFKQRVVGILQGDDRYPEVLVDAVNAAQLLTVLSEAFAAELGDAAPDRARIARFVEHAGGEARTRFGGEPEELAKFHVQLDAWLEFDYDYKP